MSKKTTTIEFTEEELRALRFNLDGIQQVYGKFKEKHIKSAIKKPFSKMVYMPCLYCQKNVAVRKDSHEHTGVFNVFCSTSNCEDKYAATL